LLLLWQHQSHKNDPIRTDKGLIRFVRPLLECQAKP
jgi:hypothetical protein